MNSKIKIIPYLTFEGNCEEALQFYQRTIGGQLQIVNRYDNPAMNAPDHYKDKVLHASLDFGDGAIYASDTFPGYTTSKSSGDVSISLILNHDLDKTRQIFNALAEGGTVGIPFDKQFWGDWHGNLTDKYGIKWNVNFIEHHG